MSFFAFASNKLSDVSNILDRYHSNIGCSFRNTSVPSLQMFFDTDAQREYDDERNCLAYFTEHNGITGQSHSDSMGVDEPGSLHMFCALTVLHRSTRG